MGNILILSFGKAHDLHVEDFHGYVIQTFASLAVPFGGTIFVIYLSFLVETRELVTVTCAEEEKQTRDQSDLIGYYYELTL